MSFMSDPISAEPRKKHAPYTRGKHDRVAVQLHWENPIVKPAVNMYAADSFVGKSCVGIAVGLGV